MKDSSFKVLSIFMALMLFFSSLAPSLIYASESSNESLESLELS
ncbi:hypothetical protein Pryu01_01717 [Paraliobacillus ryukyuensis]|uniref:Uncharacterized protein n=1 Tax=Paraliobacillus ryukyuensis TaxID=200904 RepID=A0A366E9U5_9BACI|nr:hypothetical protein [Paraliobacillus ryukyuensis]RBO98234.1 hypothetical protein DES48_10584 [Paraliobacillus ryukyuensis]